MENLLEYDQFLNENNDIVITIPKSINWEDYSKELKAAENGEILNFKVNNFPKTKKGNKCYIVHNGTVKGFMHISGLSEKEFKCTTTGKIWKGKFIERTGKFHEVEPIEMKGFQGFRYFNNTLTESKNMKQNKTKALFLDLDHTIIKPKSGKTFPTDINDWEFIPGILDKIKLYQETHYIIVVTNQGGIQSGFIREDEVLKKLDIIIKKSNESGVIIDTFFYSKTNNKNDEMRKPNPGMCNKALLKYPSIKIENSTMVGDMDTDKQFANNSNIATYYDIKEFLK